MAASSSICWRRLIAAAAGALLLALATPAEASRVRALNLEQMASRAARIVHGRFLEVVVETDPVLGQDITRITLVVARQVKGSDGRRLTFRVLGDVTQGAPRGRAIDGIPRFNRGEEVILFLYGESASGLTSPVGLGQGKFQIVTDKQGRRLAFNGRGNEGLFEGLSARVDAKLRGRGASHAPSRETPVDALLDAARAILEE